MLAERTRYFSIKCSDTLFFDPDIFGTSASENASWITDGIFPVGGGGGRALSFSVHGDDSNRIFYAFCLPANTAAIMVPLHLKKLSLSIANKAR